MPFTLRTHEFRRVLNPATQQKETRLVAEHHYIRIKFGDKPAVFLQEGRCYSQNGDAYDEHEIPEWAWDQMKKIMPDQLDVVGWADYAERHDSLTKVVPIESKKREAVTESPPEVTMEALADADRATLMRLKRQFGLPGDPRAMKDVQIRSLIEDHINGNDLSSHDKPVSGTPDNNVVIPG